jgi:hypothetical protein
MENFDEILLKIVEKRNLLSTLNFNDRKYDKVEDDLHDLEDAFCDQFGEHMEDIISQIQNKYNPYQEVLHPTAYIARKYIVKEGESGQKLYSVTRSDGVSIESTEKGEMRLVYIPSPSRLILTGAHGVHEVWNVQQPEAVSTL